MEIKVSSEFKKLKKVLLHRPGRETENLRPVDYKRLLFDDSYFLLQAQREHDLFANILKNNGVEVIYLEDLVAQTLSIDPKIRNLFIKQFIFEADICFQTSLFKRLFNFLDAIEDPKKLVVKTMEGTRVSELLEANADNDDISLFEMMDDKIWALEPLPNLIFTRDPFASIGNGVSIHHMNHSIRHRETIYAQYIFTYHPEFKETQKYYDRNAINSLEGGDIMILTETDIAVGISERTQPGGIERLARNIFSDPNSKIINIWGINIPKGRSWMHLDTVLTQIDVNKFAIFSNYEFDIYQLKKTEDDLKIITSKMRIGDLMNRVFGNENSILIPCGGGDPLYSEREQWNDGSNVLAIAPNEVIVYNRNSVTNKILREHGVIVHEIESYELSRGRGGPRCMSMPLEREE